MLETPVLVDFHAFSVHLTELMFGYNDKKTMILQSQRGI